MRGILHHLQSVCSRQIQNRVHIARQTGVMHRNDCSGARRERCPDCSHIDIQCHRIDINEHGIGTEITHHFRGCGEGQGGNNHLVAGTDAQRFQCQMQTGGCGIDRNRLATVTHVCSEFLFELPGFRSSRHPAGTQAFHDFLDFFLAYFRDSKRQEFLFIVRFHDYLYMALTI